MRINNLQNNVNFQRKLTQKELEEYKATLKEAKKITGQTGKSIFIMPSSNLPQSKKFNSGVGTISSQYAQDYIDYIRDYLGFNVVKDLPPGQIDSYKGFYCAYISSSFALGNQQINPELLIGDEFYHILSKKDLKKIAKANKSKTKNTIVNFDNVASNNGAQNQILKKAHENFLKLDTENPLRKKFEKYCIDNAFWLNFERKEEPDQDFFKFKQFLADEHLRIGKEKLNKKGLKLCGDCPLRFTYDEIRAFPNAFKKEYNMGIYSWAIPSLNFDNILDKNSDSYKLLKQKVQLFAKRYDIIRFDVAWQYVKPLLSKMENGEIVFKKENFGSALLENIESWVREIKGDDFDLKNLIWEFAADGKMFDAYENGKLIKPLKDRVKIYGTTYMHNNPTDKWGYNQALLDRGWDKESFILGVGNHDPQPLAQIAKGIPEEILGENGQIAKGDVLKPESVSVLSEILKIDSATLEDPRTFVDAKWADTMSCFNTEMFYMDVFGREERFDKQSLNLIVLPHENYAYKVPTNYKKSYHKSLQDGLGFNPMRALELNFKARGLDKNHPELFKNIQKFASILEEKKEVLDISLNKPQKIALGILSTTLLAFLGIYKLFKNNNLNKQSQTLQTTNINMLSFEEFRKTTSNLK